jgi:REP element-mobilizing transposase RayT
MHIYQRAVKGFNIFYDLEDYLVFYTIFATVARQYNVTVLELCIMIDHIHVLLSSMSLDEVSRFVMHYTSMFVREYNSEVGRKGPLFHKSFGSAPKRGSKSIRTTIVYIGNNPVEKTLCTSPEQYFWNFLEFFKDEDYGHVPVRSLSGKLKKLFKEVRGLKEKSAYLGYARLRRMFRKLDDAEREMLVRHIVREYFPFDREALLSYYDSYEDMIHAMRSTSGSEYDIKEKYSPESGAVYGDMIGVVRRYLEQNHQTVQIRKVTMLPQDEKFRIAQMLKRHTAATPRQLVKFLNMEIRKQTEE